MRTHWGDMCGIHTPVLVTVQKSMEDDPAFWRHYSLLRQDFDIKTVLLSLLFIEDDVMAWMSVGDGDDKSIIKYALECMIRPNSYIEEFRDPEFTLWKNNVIKI